MSGDPTAPLPRDTAGPFTPRPPLVLSPVAAKRVRQLLVVSSFVLAIWISAMIWMYCTTVYPLRHPSAKPSQTSGQKALLP